MPRPRHQLDDHRDYIEQALLTHESIKSIHQDLCQNFGYTGTALTIRRRIESWGLAMPAKQARTSDTKELRDRICELFFQYGLTDAEMLRMLCAEGFLVTERGLKTIRLDLSLYRRCNVERLQAAQDELRRFFEHERVTENLVHQMGREALYVHVRQRMHIIARHTLWSVYKEYHLDSVHTRRDRLQQRRGGWTCPGPNYSWSIDGYRKLAPYGFEIYAGIDAYSRFIPWFYVGVCSGTAWNVFAQYINVVANGGYLPLLLSADRGSETPLVAGAHYYLSAAVRDGPSPVQRQRPSNPLEQDGTGLHFKDCFVYCKSLRNIKIESWWDKMNRGRAIVWRVSLY